MPRAAPVISLEVKLRREVYITRWPLMCAIARNDRVAMRKLLPRGKSDPNAVCGPDGLCPLHVAAQWGRLACAEALLERGADLSKKCGKGRTPFWFACGKLAWMGPHNSGDDPLLGIPVTLASLVQVRESFEESDSDS